MDPLDLPIDRMLNLVYFWLTRNANERRKREIDTDLERPPTGESAVASGADEGAWSADAEMAAFQQAAAASASV